MCHGGGRKDRPCRTGRHVGRLNRASSGAVDFRYDAAWLGWDQASPVSLPLPLREDRFIGDPVFAVFDDLLPDSAPIRRRMAERIGAGGLAHRLALLAAR